jgi:glyoxylase-like metal-dependent hydrolase (beta-lactamase superfamily II)
MVELCLLVQTETENIVVDTGLGNKLDDRQRAIWHLERPYGDLLAGLRRKGLGPEDITLVINTHLHIDHCAGNTVYDEHGALQPTFVNARYVVQRREYDDAVNPNERTRATYRAENYEPLVARGQMQLLEGDSEIVPGVWGIVAPGHTPGHMAIRFEGAGRYAAYLCDMASYAVHFERLGWMTAYDVEPLVTLETKRRWQQWALDTDASLIFAHDTQRPLGKLTQTDNGRLEVLAVEEPFI